jgi:hypothetical protein
MLNMLRLPDLRLTKINKMMHEIIFCCLFKTETNITFNIYFKSLLGAEEGFENISAQVAELQQSQAVFPASISTSVVFLIDLLMDYNLNSNNQSGRNFS